MATQGQRLITITSSDPSAAALVAKLGTFEAKTGGGAGSETSSYTPGGTNKPVIQGGRLTFEDLTCNRVWLNERDRPLVGLLLKARSAIRFNIADQHLDQNYLPVGDPVVWHGVLSDYNHPDADSESTESARLTLVFTIDGISA